MAIKIISYKVDMLGITPATEQFAGTQGDHRTVMIEFESEEQLCDVITDYAADIGGKALYRFDVYDGEGCIWSSEPKEIENYILGLELEERHTRHGGKLTIYLVLTVLSSDGQTETELYSFPAFLRLKNRPEGIYQDGESYESLSGLAEVTKQKSAEANASAIAAENSKQELQEIAAAVEEKLKNGEFDGVGVQRAEIINDELIITYTDGTSQNLGNVKGDIGAQGVQGEKGDKGDPGADGKDMVADQTYSATSENAQSGKAVAEALGDYVKNTDAATSADLGLVKVLPILGISIDSANRLQIYKASSTDLVNKSNSYRPLVPAHIDNVVKIGLTTNTNELSEEEKAAAQTWLGIDVLVGNIEAALDELHNYAQALIDGGAE